MGVVLPRYANIHARSGLRYMDQARTFVAFIRFAPPDVRMYRMMLFLRHVFFVAFVCNVLKTTGDKIICNDCSLLTLDFHCQILLVDVYLPCLALSDLLLVRQSKVQGACSQ